jgi:hypothetical protein
MERVESIAIEIHAHVDTNKQTIDIYKDFLDEEGLNEAIKELAALRKRIREIAHG